MSAIPQPVQQRLVTDWNLRAFRAGIREVSVVQARNVLSELATLAYVRNTRAHRNQYEICSVNYLSLQAQSRGRGKRCNNNSKPSYVYRGSAFASKPPYLDR